ncbi:MAG: outer membrane protein assembly factor BamA, partial [Candidatus Omnitrophica bacterium]|nr:outer membrane protein assembly factor BamA [Candidatus Omnitrophota bacterium]
MNNKMVCFVLAIFFMFSNCAFGNDQKRLVIDIDVQNNKIIGKQTILSKLQTEKGREYSPITLSDDIKRLYATGLFRDVSADVQEKEEGVKIIFKVFEKSKLGKVIFFGNRKIKTKKLLAEMKVKKGEIFDQFQLKEDVGELKNFYAKKGYSLADIKYEIEEKENIIELKIIVDEGKRLRIKKIDFINNKNYTDKRLLKLIKTKKRWLMGSGFLKDDVLQEDVERLIAFYRSEGFLDIKVNSLIEYNENKTLMSINFLLEEGIKYKVGKVAFTGNTIFSEETIKEQLVLLPEVIFSEDKLRKDISSIQNSYFDKGYISSSVKADTILNPQTGRVDLSYSIIENNIAYVDKVNIQGNTRTKDVVIRREMRLFPGDRYNGEKLRRSRERLYNLGYFEEVTFDTSAEPTTLPDKHDMDIFVKESKTGEFSFGAGYSSVDRFIGFVDLTQRNFDILNFPTFTGAGQKLRVRMEFGSDRKDYELGFVEPWFLGYPVSTGFNVFSRTRDWDKYDEKRIGGDVFVSKDFDEYWNGKLTHRYESIRITDIVSDASRDIKAKEGKNYISSVILDVTHDSRDNIYNPTKGWLNAFSVEHAGGILNGDKDFVRYFSRQSKY